MAATAATKKSTERMGGSSAVREPVGLATILAALPGHASASMAAPYIAKLIGQADALGLCDREATVAWECQGHDSITVTMNGQDADGVVRGCTIDLGTCAGVVGAIEVDSGTGAQLKTVGQIRRDADKRWGGAQPERSLDGQGAEPPATPGEKDKQCVRRRTINEFLNACCVFSPMSFVREQELEQAAAVWMHARELDAPTTRQLHSCLIEHDPKAVYLDSHRGYEGVRLAIPVAAAGDTTGIKMPVPPSGKAEVVA